MAVTGTKESIKRGRINYYLRWPNARLYEYCRRRAKKKNLPCTITKEDVIIPTHCPVFGFPIVLNKGKLQYNSPSVDRIINELGYVPGNIVVVSYMANAMKRTGTVDDLRRLYEFYKNLTVDIP